jgi:hypothetical protein
MVGTAESAYPGRRFGLQADIRYKMLKEPRVGFLSIFKSGVIRLRCEMYFALLNKFGDFFAASEYIVSNDG